MSRESLAQLQTWWLWYSDCKVPFLSGGIKRVAVSAWRLWGGLYSMKGNAQNHSSLVLLVDLVRSGASIAACNGLELRQCLQESVPYNFQVMQQGHRSMISLPNAASKAKLCTMFISECGSRSMGSAFASQSCVRRQSFEMKQWHLGWLNSPNRARS